MRGVTCGGLAFARRFWGAEAEGSDPTSGCFGSAAQEGPWHPGLESMRRLAGASFVWLALQISAVFFRLRLREPRPKEKPCWQPEAFGLHRPNDPKASDREPGRKVCKSEPEPLGSFHGS